MKTHSSPYPLSLPADAGEMFWWCGGWSRTSFHRCAADWVTRALRFSSRIFAASLFPSSPLSFTTPQNIPVSAGVFIRARRALSRYSPTARNRLLFNLPNSRKDIFMQTMRTVCPDCGSEMFNQPDDFDFETNFTGVSCADCGREITKDDVVNQATDTVKKQIDDMLRNSLKGTGWKF
ncbi:ECs_2282 family putative zinc-binding protein [Citrobacter freundii]|uniref:ECs_2282 family putative zinc-binding protein n=1 Tax=Citrobacter freundii TaxID=546 RepID=UPI003C715632